MKKVICSPNAPAALGPYSQAIKAGNTVYMSGQLGINPSTGELVSGGISEQSRQALLNLKAVMDETGISADNVVKTTVFLTDMQNFNALNEVYKEVFTKDCPARSCIAVAGLPKGALVEIEAIAVL